MFRNKALSQILLSLFFGATTLFAEEESVSLLDLYLERMAALQVTTEQTKTEENVSPPTKPKKKAEQLFDSLYEDLFDVEMAERSGKANRFSYKTGQYYGKSPSGTNDLNLQQAFAAVLENNPDLTELRLQLLEDEANFGAKQAAHRGDWSFRLLYNRSTSDSSGFVDNDEQYDNANQFVAEVRYQFPWFHKSEQITEYEKAALQIEYTRLSYQQQVRLLEQKLLTAFYETVLFERYVDIEQVAVDMAASRCRQVKKSFEIGKASSRDILMENNDLLEKQMLLRTAREDALLKRRALFELMGEPLDETRKVVDDLTIDHTLINRADAQMVEWQSAALSNQVEQIALDKKQAGQWFEPRLILRGWYSNDDSIEEEDGYHVGGVVELPIPSYTEIQKKKASSAAAMASLENKTEAVRSRSARRVAFLEKRMRRLAESLAMNTRLHYLRAEELKVARSDFDLGKITRMELLYTEESSTKTERLFHQTLFEYVDTAAQLRIERGEHIFPAAERAAP